MSNEKQGAKEAKAKPVAGDAAAQETWARVQLARRLDRPHTLDYIRQIFTDFVELHGDRAFGDDPAVVGGLARLDERTVLVLGHQKGANTKENVARNFGMAHPEGYRKALRLMRQAEKFGFPVITFIDTPAASPDKGSEERGMALAIADNLLAMLTLRVPILAVVVGEGGSGGALAIGVADRLLMLENAIYSVAPPEAAAAILWHNAGKAAQAAQAMKISAADLLAFGLADRLIPEPPGGAQADVPALMEAVGAVLREELAALEPPAGKRTEASLRQLLAARQARYKRMGVFEEPDAAPPPSSRAAGNARNGRDPAAPLPAPTPKATPTT